MPKIARIGDRTFGPCIACQASVYGRIVEGASKTSCEGPMIARLGDEVQCDSGHSGYIDSSSPDVSAEGPLIARKGDTYSGVYSGEIIEGASISFAN